MKTTGRILSVVLALMLVLSSLTVFAEDVVVEEPVVLSADEGTQVADEGDDDADTDTDTPTVDPDHFPHHVLAGTEKTEPATCGKDGYYQYECADCHTIQKTTLPATGDHTVSEDDLVLGGMKAPSCTEDGYKTYKKCSVCGQENVKVVDKALGHSWGDPAVTAPTCTEKGYSVYECLVCHVTETRDEVAALGHDLVDVSDREYAKDATCWEMGITGGFEYCTRCGKYFEKAGEEGEYIPKLDHKDYVEKLFVYGADGKTFIWALADDVEEWTKLSKGGWWNAIGEDYDFDCYGEVYYTYEWESCEKGGTFVWYCEKEGCKYHEKQTVTFPPTDHDWQEIDDGHDIDDCTKPYKKGYYCPRCDAEKEEDGETFSDHDYDYETIIGYRQTATNVKFTTNENDICKGSNYVQVVKCKRCSVTKDIPVPGDETKHAFDDTYYVKKDATCTENGREIYYCPKCKVVVDHVLPAKGHVEKKDAKKVVTKAATCTEEGEYTYYCTRTGCNAVIDTERIPAIGHHYLEKNDPKNVAMDCGKNIPGLQLMECEYCKDQYWKDIPVEHTFDETSDTVYGYIAPTCTTPGEISGYCEVCHQKMENVQLPKLGHAHEREDFDPDWREDYPELFHNGLYWDTFEEADCQHGDLWTFYCKFCDKTIKCEEGGKNLDNHAAYDKKNGKLGDIVILNNSLSCGATVKIVYNCADCKEIVEKDLGELPHHYVTHYDADMHAYISSCMPFEMSDPDALDDAKGLLELWFSEYDEQFGKIGEAIYNRLVDLSTGKYLYGIGCGEGETIRVERPEYKITKKDNTITIELKEEEMVPLKNPMVHVTLMFTTATDESIAFTMVYPVTMDSTNTKGSFTLMSSHPFGATLDGIYAIVVNEDYSESMPAQIGLESRYGAAEF